MTYSDVLRLEGINRATLYRRIARGRYCAVPGRDGEKAIPLWCLSAQARERHSSQQSAASSQGTASGVTEHLSLIGGERAPQDVTPPVHESTYQPARPPYPSIPVRPDGMPDLAAMEGTGLARHAREFERRMAAVAEVRSRLTRTRTRTKGNVWAEVAGAYGVAARTLQHWDQVLREAGPVALVPAWGLAQRRDYRAIPDVLQGKVLEAWDDFCGRTVRQIYRTIVLPWCQSQGIDPPSYRTVCVFVERETRPIEDAAFRVGPREFKAKFAAKVVRDIESIGVNEWWCADHRKFDIMVLAPGSTAGGGCATQRAVRPWMTLICDIRTAAFVGYRLCETPSAASVSHAVRSAALSVGLPQVFYRDNGKEFSARRLGGKAARLRHPTQGNLKEQSRWPAALPAALEANGLWAGLGVKVSTSLPYFAWSKPIESFMGAWARMWENMIPGFTGKDAKDKPEVLAKHLAEGKLLTWEQFEEVVADLFAWWNSEHICGDRKETPAQAYAALRRSSGEPRIPERQALDVLLQDQRALKVRPHGIKLDGRVYQSVELGPWVGADVAVRWDPGEPGEIIVYTPDGERIAVAEAPKADYKGFNEANELAKRVERGQRAYLREKRAERSGFCTRGELDPTGAFTLVQERLATEGALRQAQGEALERASEEAEAQLDARERMEQGGDDEHHELLRRMGRRVFEEQDQRRGTA